MVENAKRLKRGFITEEDISITLQRYPATTVLALLQEVAQVQDEKFDWNAMVQKTRTGISSAREYQMLWRHLAYGKSLVERPDDEGEPLDDDSDLDYELEALPSIAPEVSAEAVACVKVLIASGTPCNSSLPSGSTVEAPLTINIPNGKSTRPPSESSQPSNFGHGTNITVPVSVQKLPAVTCAEGLDTNGLASGNLPPRRKRKPWSAAEDMELIAAVKKCGEGNWANILKGDFKSERSASQLSQRWNIIRKRKGNSSLGSGSQLSEAQLAARRAVSLALNMPMTDKLKSSSSSPAGMSSAILPSNSIHPTVETSFKGIKREPQSEQDSLPTAHRPEIFSPSAKQDSLTTAIEQSGTLAPSAKPRVNLSAPSKSIPGRDELVKAAVAAGGRIATQSDAASLFKAARAKNVVHVIPGGGSMTKASIASTLNSLPSNVHYIRTGLATTPLSTYSSATPSRPASAQQNQVHPVNQRQSSLKVNVPSGATKAATPTPGIINEVETRTSEDIIPSSGNASKEFVQDDKASEKANSMREKLQNQTAFGGISQQGQEQGGDSGPHQRINENQVSISGDTLLDLIEEDLVKLVPASCSAVGVSDTVNHGNQTISECSIANDNNMIGMDICQNHSVNEKADGAVAMDTCETLGEYVKQEDITSMSVVAGEE